MKKFRITTVLAAISLMVALNVNAQPRTVEFEKYVIINVLSGNHTGEVYEGVVTFGMEPQSKYLGSNSWTVAYMNKAELINTIASESALSKADSKNPTSSKVYKKPICRIFGSQNQYLLTFEDGTTCDVTKQIKYIGNGYMTDDTVEPIDELSDDEYAYYSNSL